MFSIYFDDSIDYDDNNYFILIDLHVFYNYLYDFDASILSFLVNLVVFLIIFVFISLFNFNYLDSRRI